MRLGDIGSGSLVFIDANIFLYSIGSHPVYGEPCKKFLKRVEEKTFDGRSSVVVFNELLHKLVLGEISMKHGLSLPQSLNLIKKNPHVLSSLEAYSLVDKLEEIPNLTVHEFTPQILSSARVYMRRYSLMSNDAIHVATCKSHGIKDIATNDADFQRVHFLRVWKP